jgi:hypothetical protein
MASLGPFRLWPARGAKGAPLRRSAARQSDASTGGGDELDDGARSYQRCWDRLRPRWRRPSPGPSRDLAPNPSLFPEASCWVGCGIPSAGLSAVGRGRCRSGIGRAAPWSAPLAIGRPGGPDASGDASNQRSRRRDGAQRGCKRRLTARSRLGGQSASRQGAEGRRRRPGADPTRSAVGTARPWLIARLGTKPSPASFWHVDSCDLAHRDAACSAWKIRNLAPMSRPPTLQNSP